MATLQELKERNRQLKIEIQSKKKLLEIAKERKKLMKENAKIAREIKFGNQIRLAKKLGKALSGTGSVAKAIAKHAVKIAEAEAGVKRPSRRRTKIKATRKKTTKKKR